MEEGIKYSTIDEERMLSAEELDRERKKNRVYEYMCHLQEAKEWIEKEINEKIEGEFEETLKNGVVLAKLVRIFSPETVPKIFESSVLQYKHTDNINAFFEFSKKIGLPMVFLFDLIDLYDGKNIPKVIYCIHALAHFLARKSITGHLKNLVGKATFTDAEIQKKEKEIEESGINLPSFNTISSTITKDEEEKKEQREREQEPDQIHVTSYNEYLNDYIPNGTEAQNIIQSYVRTLLWKRVISEITGQRPLTIFSLRKLLPLLTGEEEKDESVIDELNKILIALFKDNSTKERQVNMVENRISLLIKNRLNCSSKSKKEKHSYMQYTSLQKLFSRMQTDPKILCTLITAMPQREAEAFVSTKLTKIFGGVKGPREEYGYLEVIEELIKAEKELKGPKQTETPGRLGACALKALLGSSLSLAVHRKLLREIELGKSAEEIVSIHVNSVSELPYSIRFYVSSLLTMLNNKYPGLSLDNSRHAFVTMWETLFIPFILSLHLETAQGESLITDTAGIRKVCSEVSEKVLGDNAFWESMATRFSFILDIQPISEYYTLQYLETSTSTNLVCLTREEINYLLNAINRTNGIPEDIKEYSSDCYPFPFEVIFVLPGGFSPNMQESPGSTEKRLAKWALNRLLLCCTAKNVGDLLQRRASKEESLIFNTLCKTDMEKYKDDTRVLIARLVSLGEIQNPTTCDELLQMIGEDILFRVKKKFTRSREIEATQKAITNLESARKTIDKRLIICNSYLDTLRAKILKPASLRINTAIHWLSKGILVSMNNWTPEQLKSIEIAFKTESTNKGKIVITVLVLILVHSEELLNLDDLLQEQSTQNEYISLGNISCVFHTQKLLDLINKNFLK
ncbi:hypothetical protein NEOKW01_0849 [Nematocida sp. AWRm80]|nr:hypothetical protein NEOKW01_0849 [Nematocida sp. AWRm80]